MTNSTVKITAALASATFAASAFAQTYISKIKPLDGEKWWGGANFFGQSMPYGDFAEKDIASSNYSNQADPFFVSSKGRYIWSDKPFKFSVKNGELTIISDYGELKPEEGGKTLKDAFLAASKKHFPPSGTIPPELFFSMPQYNTWIELQRDQNQKGIEKYADDIVKNGFPIGVFMIDGGWQKYQGNYEFRPEAFSDPKAMFDKINSMGFKTILWVAPFVAPDSAEFRDLKKRGLLVMRKSRNSPAILHWWSGYSAAYDLTNPEAADALKGVLRGMQKKYGMDGFKFDAGDTKFVVGDFKFHKPGQIPADYTHEWSKFALDFPYNEFRANAGMAGQPVVLRLQDKCHTWKDLRRIIPDMLAAGIAGYPYTCPDMIGGGDYISFQPGAELDEKLIVRSCQAHALMPMMQFSVAPWRVLSKENMEICRKFANLHKEFGPYILALVLVNLVGQILSKLQDYTVYKLEIAGNYHLARLCFDTLSNQSMTFHTSRFGGSLVSQTSRFMSGYTGLVDVTVYSLIPTITSVICTVAALAPVVPTFTVILVCIMVVYIAFVWLMYKRIMPLSAATSAAQNKLSGVLSDAVTNILAVKTCGREDFERDLFDAADRAARDAETVSMHAMM